MLEESGRAHVIKRSFQRISSKLNELSGGDVIDSFLLSIHGKLVCRNSVTYKMTDHDMAVGVRSL